VKPTILTFADSARRDSLNKQLARIAADHTAAQGAEAAFVDLADYELPSTTAMLNRPTASRQMRSISRSLSTTQTASSSPRPSTTAPIRRSSRTPSTGSPESTIGRSPGPSPYPVPLRGGREAVTAWTSSGPRSRTWECRSSPSSFALPHAMAVLKDGVLWDPAANRNLDGVVSSLIGSVGSVVAVAA